MELNIEKEREEFERHIPLILMGEIECHVISDDTDINMAFNLWLAAKRSMIKEIDGCDPYLQTR